MSFSEAFPKVNMPFSKVCSYWITLRKKVTVTERHWRTSSIPNFNQIGQQICTALVEISVQL